MHTFMGTVDVGWRVEGEQQMRSKRIRDAVKSRIAALHLLGTTLIQTAFPACPMEKAEMRPITNITIFGCRLAMVVLAIYWLGIFVGTHLPNFGEIVDLRLRINDKVKHFSAFFLLGSLLCYVTNSSRWWKRFSLIGLAGMSYAAVDEITQNFIPGRYPDVLDFAADAAGLWTAILLYVAAKWVYLLLTKQTHDGNLA